jgi:hypothetical protein
MGVGGGVGVLRQQRAWELRPPHLQWGAPPAHRCAAAGASQLPGPWQAARALASASTQLHSSCASSSLAPRVLQFFVDVVLAHRVLHVGGLLGLGPLQYTGQYRASQHARCEPDPGRGGPAQRGKERGRQVVADGQHKHAARFQGSTCNHSKAPACELSW